MNGTVGRRFAPDFLTELFRHPLDPGYADAAARRASHGPRPPWRRRGAFGLRVLALLVIGFLLAVAYRVAVRAEPESTRAHAGLVAQVKAAQAGSDALRDQDDQLRRQVTLAQQQALGGTAEQLRQILIQEAAVGLAAVTGPGLVVRLADAAAPIDPNTGKTSGAEVNRVLDVDLQAVVNALWATGAEAIAINGQRLTALSTIRRAGATVLVDKAGALFLSRGHLARTIESGGGLGLGEPIVNSACDTTRTSIGMKSIDGGGGGGGKVKKAQ